MSLDPKRRITRTSGHLHNLAQLLGAVARHGPDESQFIPSVRAIGHEIMAEANILLALADELDARVPTVGQSHV
jgi:hypothetical protein